MGKLYEWFGKTVGFIVNGVLLLIVFVLWVYGFILKLAKVLKALMVILAFSILCFLMYFIFFTDFLTVPMR